MQMHLKPRGRRSPGAAHRFKERAEKGREHAWKCLGTIRNAVTWGGFVCLTVGGWFASVPVSPAAGPRWNVRLPGPYCPPPAGSGFVPAGGLDVVWRSHRPHIPRQHLCTEESRSAGSHCDPELCRRVGEAMDLLRPRWLVKGRLCLNSSSCPQSLTGCFWTSSV